MTTFLTIGHHLISLRLTTANIISHNRQKWKDFAIPDFCQHIRNIQGIFYLQSNYDELSEFKAAICQYIASTLAATRLEQLVTTKQHQLINCNSQFDFRGKYLGCGLETQLSLLQNLLSAGMIEM